MNSKVNVEEIEQIKYEYSSHEPTKLDQLKKLDRQVKTPAEVFAYTFGSAGALVLGTGMCLTMGVIGASLASPIGMIVGVAVGVVGIAMVSANYFIYNAILKKRKAKHAKQILDISSELLNENAE